MTDNMETKEVLELIANRVPPGDRWTLVGEEKVYPSLTEALNAWSIKTKEKAEFRLAPLDSKLYVIRTEKYEPEIKTYNIYGESF